MESTLFKKGISCLASAALVAMLTPAVGGGVALAEENDTTQWWQSYVPSSETAVNSSLIETYGVRAGSAGGDYLGLTNTNFDFTAGRASSNYQYFGYANLDADDDALAGLAIWGSSANADPNPYYANLFYNVVNNKVHSTAFTVDDDGVAATEYYMTADSGVATPYATTWMKNPSTSSWGDSLGYGKVLASDGATSTATVAAGMEFGGPDVVFGAAKTSGWTDYTASGTNFATYDQNDNSWNPTYANNDATNLWTQIYTEGQLASAVESGKVTSTSNLYNKKTRYQTSDTPNGGNAVAHALAYEKSIRGNLLYIASQIDAYNKAIASGEYTAATAPGIAQKTVAYLYAVDETEGYAYFFTPSASNMLNGTDSGGSATNSESTPSYSDGSNNGTMSLGYMDVLPFITTTYSAGDSMYITMKVEDIYKANTACKVPLTELSASLASVDYVIFNTNNDLTGDGTSGGKNLSGVKNTGDFANGLSRSALENYLGISSSKLIAGDDFGTSTKASSETNQAPLLYCQRNYTMDKNARAAWVFSKVYPELYSNKSDSSYAYWVENVYHIDSAAVDKVVAYMTNQAESAVSAVPASTMEQYYQTGLNWWTDASTGLSDPNWAQFAYYNGSSRASYYSTSAEATPSNTVGIFQPSTAWLAAESVEAEVGRVSASRAALNASVSLSTQEEADDLPTKDNPITIGGVQWYTDEDNVVYIDPAETPMSGYESGVLKSNTISANGTIKNWSGTVGSATTKYVFGEGITSIEGGGLIPLYPATTKVVLPASLKTVASAAISPTATAYTEGLNVSYEIHGVYDDHFTESELSEVGNNGLVNIPNWRDVTLVGDITITVPETCAVGTHRENKVFINKVPYQGYSTEAPEVGDTTFVYDGQIKSLGIESTDDYKVGGDYEATNEGVYIAKVSLIDKFHEWSDGTTDDIYIAWIITSSIYSESDLEAAKDDAAEEAAAKVEKDAAKAACEAAGIAYDESKSAADNMAAAKVAADAAAEQAKIAAIEEAVAAAQSSQMSQDLTIDTSVKTVKAPKGKKKLTKKKTTSKIKVTGAKGAVSFAKVAKGSSKKLTVNKKTGKITVKKGTKKGTYKVKVKVTAAESGNYKATSATVTVSVIVK